LPPCRVASTRVTFLRLTLVAIGAAAVAIGVLGCARSRQPCPAGHTDDPARTARIRSLLKTTSEGESLLSGARQPPRVCFGQVDRGVLRTDGIAVLSLGASDGQNAARLGHLLLHEAEGPPLPTALRPDANCDVLVAKAVEAEARAHALEQRLSHELRLDAAVPFDTDQWSGEFAALCQRSTSVQP
jgi:hypothetical protein